MPNSNTIDLKQLNRIKTFGDSMYPLLHDGDIVYLEPVSFNNIKVDDIIIGHTDNRYYTHRVIYKTDSYLLTKGENNLQPDAPLTKDKIVGRVKYMLRNKNKIDIELFYLMQSTVYFNEIRKIMNLLQQNSLSFVILKGLPLHLYYEKKHPRRLYADCDILISYKDREKLNELLVSKGYKLQTTEVPNKVKGNIPQLTYVTTTKEFPVCFDIHFDPSITVIHIDTKDALFSDKVLKAISTNFLLKKRIIKIEGIHFPILSKDHLVVYLALHFFHHNYKGIFRLEFIHKVVCKETKDSTVWKDSEEIISRYNLQNFVYPVFIFLQKYYDTAVPTRFIEAIKPRSLFARYFINKRVLNISPFEDETWITRGINRFLYLLILSPNPWYKKLFVFFNIEVLSMVIWVVKKRIIIVLRWLLFGHKKNRS